MASSKPKLRLAVIGGGLFAQHNHIPQLLKLQHLIQVVAVWSNSKSSAETAASLLNDPSVGVYYHLDENGKTAQGKAYEDILARDDVDAVDLIITIDSMPNFIEKALAAGKHVLSEKPMAPTVQQGREMLARFKDVHLKRKPGLVWSVAEQIWYEPGWRTLMDYRMQLPNDASTAFTTEPQAPAQTSAATGAISTPHLANIGTPVVAALTRIGAMNSTNKYYVTKWRATPNYQGGYLLDGGVHEICKLRMSFGEIQEVTALTHQFKPDLPPADSLVASIRFKSGLLCNFTYTFTASTLPIAISTVPYDLVITGTQGGAMARNTEIVCVASGGADAEVKRHTIPVENEMGQLSIRREIESFALAALGRGQECPFGLYTPEQALQDVAVIQALLQSSQSGQRVLVESVGTQ